MIRMIDRACKMRSLAALAAASLAWLALCAGPARAQDAPPSASAETREDFEMFYGTSTTAERSFHSIFATPDDGRLEIFANYLADQIGTTADQRQTLRPILLRYMRGMAGQDRKQTRHAHQQYAFAAILYGLGRTEDMNIPPLSWLPVRTEQERSDYANNVRRFYQDWMSTRSEKTRADYAGFPPLTATGFFTRLAADIDGIEWQQDAGRYAATIPLGADSPLARLAPWAIGVQPRRDSGSNPFVPPARLVTASADGTPALDFSRIGSSADSPFYMEGSVLYQRTAAGRVEVGRTWTQGGFSYLNYTGPTGDPQRYGQVFPLGENGALPSGVVQALPPGIDYSRIETRTVTDYLGGTRQVALLPAGNGRYQDLDGNAYAVARRQEQTWLRCGPVGRRLCAGSRTVEEIRPAEGGNVPPDRLDLARSGGPAQAGQFELTALPQPNAYGSSQELRRNGQTVGYVLRRGNEQVIFMGGPTASRWAIYRMDGALVTSDFSGGPILERDIGGRTVHLIPLQSGGWVDFNGNPWQMVANGAFRRTGL